MGQKYIISKEEQNAFAQQLKLKQSMSIPSSQQKIGNIGFSPTRQEYKLVEEDWACELSLKCFSWKETYRDYEMFKDESLQGYFHHHFEGLFVKKKHFKEWISGYTMDYVLQILHYLLNVISPDILCMNSMVPNLFVTTNNTAIKSTGNSICRLSNDKLFEGIDMFLVPVLNHFLLLPMCN